MQPKLSATAKAASSKVLSEYARRFDSGELSSPDAIARYGDEVINAAWEAAKTVDSSAERNAVAQQWHGMKRWLLTRKQPQAIHEQPLSTSGQKLDPATGIHSMEAPEFIRLKLKEARQHLGRPSRSTETNLSQSTPLLFNGQPISYVPADATTEKSNAIPAFSEPPAKPASPASSITSTLKVRLPDGTELYFDGHSRTVVSVSSVGTTGATMTYTIMSDIA